MVAARVTPEEHAAWQAKAEAAGVSPSRLLRQATARTRTWTAAEVERERTRQIARVGNNLNQIARWANTHASPMDAIEMIAYLVHIARTLDKVARVGREADGARLVHRPRDRLGRRGGRLPARRAGRGRPAPRGRRGPPRRSRRGGRRRRRAGVRAQVHLRRDRVGAGRPPDGRADRGRAPQVRADGVGGTGAGSLRVDGGRAQRARRRRSRACPRRAVRSGDGQEPQHRPARLAEDVRPAARRLQPRARLESARRPGAGAGAAARPPRLHRRGEAAGGSGGRGRPARVDPGLPGAARRARRRS